MARVLLLNDDARSNDRILRLIALREPGWEVQLASTVPEAWDAVEIWQPEAVVAAAHAPSLDGLELLGRVQHGQPATVRVALGVDRDAELSLRAMRLAHRALPDPVDPAALLEILRGMLLLNAVIARPRVREMLGRLGSLPAVPSVYAELTRRLEDSNASVYELAQLVAADTTLAAQVLRIANSASFTGKQRVTQIEAAAARLGTRLLRSVVLTAEVYARFPVSPFMAERLEALQSHASLVARLASALEPGAAWKDDAFTAGLLHDIGKLVLASHLGETHAKIVRDAERAERPEFEVEVERLGDHHGAIGACLLGMWGLPSTVLEAALHHHDRLEQIRRQLDPVTAVAIANRLAHVVARPGILGGAPGWGLDVLMRDPRWTAWRDLAFSADPHDLAA
jgi:HD-like signal output (HDOD) protein